MCKYFDMAELTPNTMSIILQIFILYVSPSQYDTIRKISAAYTLSFLGYQYIMIIQYVFKHTYLTVY